MAGPLPCTLLAHLRASCGDVLKHSMGWTTTARGRGLINHPFEVGLP